MIKKMLIIIFLLGLRTLTIDAQIIKKSFPFTEGNLPVFLAENAEGKILFTCDSLLKLAEYEELVNYVKQINSQLSLRFQTKKPLFQARLLLQATKAEARLSNVIGSYDLLKRAEQHLFSTDIVDSALNQEIYSFLSNASRRLGFYEEALKYAHMQLPFINENQNALEKADAYNSLGLIHSRLFNKQLALKYFNKCYSIREKVAPEWLPFVMNNIGLLYQRTREYDSALYWYNKAYHFKHPLLGEDIFVHATLLANTSNIYSAQSQNDEALAAINESIRIRLKYEKENNNNVLAIALDKVDVLLNLRDLKKAQLLLDFIKASLILGNDPSLDNSYYMRKAKFKVLINEFDSALFLMDEAIHSLDSNFDRQNVKDFLKGYTPNFPEYGLISTLEEKGNMYLKHFKLTNEMADLSLAILYNQKAVEFMNTYIYRQPNFISDPGVYYHSQRLFGKQLNLLDQLKIIDSTAVSSTELTKLFEADRMHSVKKTLIYNQLLAGDSHTEKLLKERARLNNFLMKINSKDANLQKQDSTFNQLNELEIKLKSAMGSLYDLKIKETYLIPNNYLEDLKENTALVQYFFADSILHCLYATKEHFKWYKVDWAPKDDECLKSALSMLKNPANQQYTYLEDLGIKLLPFLKDQKETELMIIPSGILNHLPFEALIVSGDFLVKTYTISYLEALSWPLNTKPKRTNKFLGFAPFVSSKPPVFNNETVSAFRNNNELSELTGSLKEIENGASYFNSEIFASSAATETQLKSNSLDLKAVHLATHGLMEDNNPLMNSIVLVGDSLNDGLLHTYELFHLKLPAELAILSACNTGTGNYQHGEGLLSLATGFYTAGVQNILFTLWSIPDRQSTELVSDFYQYWQDENKTMSEALRDAKLNYLTHADELNKHPSFWAGFVLHQKQITKKEAKKVPIWPFGGGFVLLVILLFFIISKRNQSKASSTSRAL